MASLALSEMQIEAMKEVGNIGAGHAATALSEMLNEPVQIGTPTVEILPFAALAGRVSRPGRIVSAVHFNVLGEDVLITGAGPIGVMAAAVAKHAGARYVVVTDVNPYRLDLARKMGATLAIDRYFADDPSRIIMLPTGQAFVMRPAASSGP